MIDDGAIEGLDLSTARIVVNGAEPVRAASVRAFCARFAAHGFDPGALAPVYGLAESSVGLAFPRPGRGLLAERIDRTELAERSRAVPVTSGHGDAIEVVACGSPLPGHQFRVVDESGREVPERHQGRLQFTGPSATVGYHDNAQATRSLFDGDWLETGDLAYIAGGEVYPTGRIKDVIIRGGRNIHPHELEAAIGDLPGIRRGCVAVFAAAGPDRAERLVVVAETREEDDAARDRLRRGIEAAAVDVAGIAPDDVVLAPPRAVLKTSSGKIRRAATLHPFRRGVSRRSQTRRRPRRLLVPARVTEAAAGPNQHGANRRSGGVRSARSGRAPSKRPGNEPGPEDPNIPRTAAGGANARIRGSGADSRFVHEGVFVLG